MIKLKNPDVYGFEAAIRGMRNPWNSWEKSDSVSSDVHNCVECAHKEDFSVCYPKPQRTHTIHKRLFLPQLRARICRNMNSRLLLPLRSGYKVG